MEIQNKNYCYTFIYALPNDSSLRKLYIKDILSNLDIEKLIQIFIDDSYELLIKIDQDRKINQFICKTYHKEKIDKDIIKCEAFEKIIVPSLQCLQFAFIGLQRQGIYTSPAKDIHQNYMPLSEILNYETGEKEKSIKMSCYLDEPISFTLSMQERHLSSEDICKVLKTRQEVSVHINIDEYIERFLSIENLSTDPVLHLITLFSLYEYIKGSKGSDLSNKYFQEVNKKGSKNKLEKVFSSTRNLVAHGFAGGGRSDERKTAETLKEFLGEPNSKGCYSFDRYNSKHINLINEVIGESQTVIEKYLKYKLKIDL